MFQKTILRDKAMVDVFKAMLSAVNPVKGIVGRYQQLRKDSYQGCVQLFAVETKKNCHFLPFGAK